MKPDSQETIFQLHCDNVLVLAYSFATSKGFYSFKQRQAWGQHPYVCLILSGCIGSYGKPSWYSTIHIRTSIFRKWRCVRLRRFYKMVMLIFFLTNVYYLQRNTANITPFEFVIV